MSILCLVVFANLFLICSCTCLSKTTLSTYFVASSNQKENNAAASTVNYCIYLGIRFQADNNIVKTVYIQDTESNAKNLLSTSLMFNSTISSKVVINCSNKLSVETSDNVLSYSYYCCPDTNAQLYETYCNTPTLIPFRKNPDGPNDSSTATTPTSATQTTKATNNHKDSDGNNASAVIFVDIFLLFICASFKVLQN